MSFWKNKAFTLMELMVATVITSVIFILVSSFLWLAFKTSTRSKEMALRYAGVRNVFDILTQEIHSAGSFSYPDNQPDFVVQEGKIMSFWCIPPFYTGDNAQNIHISYEGFYRAPIFKITYELKHKNGRTILYKRIQSPWEEKYLEFPMIAGDFEFSVIYYDNDRKELVESKEYEGKELPVAVRIKCIFPDGNELTRRIFVYEGKRF